MLTNIYYILAGVQQETRFFVFHDWGIAVYEPEECRLFHVIQGTDVIPGTQEYVCGDKGNITKNYLEKLELNRRY